MFRLFRQASLQRPGPDALLPGKVTRADHVGIRPRRNLAARLRAYATLVAAALAIGQLLTLAHFALTPHEICPVDGVLAHVPHHVPIAAEPGRKIARDPLVAPGVPEQHSHDHCTVASRLHEKLAVLHAGRTYVAIAPVSERAGPAREACVARAPQPLLSLAPKLSPPA